MTLRSRFAAIDSGSAEADGRIQPVEWADVLAFAYPAGNEAVVEDVIRAFKGTELVRNAGKERYETFCDTAYGLSQDEFFRRRKTKPRYLAEDTQEYREEIFLTYKSARYFFYVALSCLELLKRSEGDLRYDDASEIGIAHSSRGDGKTATIELEFAGYVQGSNYLQYLAENCRSMPPWFDCRMDRIHSDSKLNDYWGWTVERAGCLKLACGEYHVECSRCPDSPQDALSDAQIRETLTTVLNGLITLHLQDARPYSAGQRGLRLSGGCLLSRLWMALLESMKDGELSFCPACGKPFLIKRYRGNERIWCEMNGTCAKKGQRARNFGRFCKLGYSPEAAGRKAGIKPATARKLLERLGELHEDVDYGA